MNFSKIFEYYSREDVQNAIFTLSRNREVTGVFRNGSYGIRPNSIVYMQDILAMVKSGAIEFHCSLERWKNPMALSQDNYNELRAGWDIIFDIDCKKFEHGKIATKVIIWALKKHGIKGFSVKFTGSKGFHIAVPWESLPKDVNYEKIQNMFPELPRKVCSYLKYFTKDKLEKDFLKVFSPEELAEDIGKPLGKILKNDNILPFEIVEIDHVLISPRHLFRMPYSLHKDTSLVSLPLKPEDLDEFEREHAGPEKIKVDKGYLNFEPAPGSKKYYENEADLLIMETIDFWTKRQIKEKKIAKRKMEITKTIPREFFPPCIRTILEGISDGRKRSAFILINFLSSLKWKWENIEALLNEWNQKNKPPLRESYLRGQLRYKERDGTSKQSILPPNCANEAYYINFDACKPDSICKGGGEEKIVKNPVNYPFMLMKKGRTNLKNTKKKKSRK